MNDFVDLLSPGRVYFFKHASFPVIDYLCSDDWEETGAFCKFSIQVNSLHKKIFITTNSYVSYPATKETSIGIVREKDKRDLVKDFFSFELR